MPNSKAIDRNAIVGAAKLGYASANKARTMTSRTKAERTLPQLTRKQREVLALVADNRTSKEIAGLLGISESAVNQRIEIVRARLGGLPRGELARLYRLNFSTDEPANDQTWQKIHLPISAGGSQRAGAESIQSGSAEGPQVFGDAGLDGSQLSAFFPPSNSPWLTSEQRPMAMARFMAIGVIVFAALAIAVVVTSLLGPGGAAH